VARDGQLGLDSPALTMAPQDFRLNGGFAIH